MRVAVGIHKEDIDAAIEVSHEIDKYCTLPVLVSFLKSLNKCRTYGNLHLLSPKNGFHFVAIARIIFIGLRAA